MNMCEAAAKLRPGTAWNLRGGVLEQADDAAPRVKPPAAADLKAIMDADAYVAARAAEYPAISDQLDALWKGGDAAAAMAKTIQAVKDKYPKFAQ